MPTPQQQALLAGFAERLDACAHGEAAAIIAEAAAALGVAAQTVHAWLKPHRAATRKQRADAGVTALDDREIELLASVLNEGPRMNGKQIVSLKDAVGWLRASGQARFERVSAETGEITPLADSTIARALNRRQLHQAALRAAAPHQPLATPHPNHTWQVDASVCVVFYLPGGGAMMAELKEAEHYKNKPENIRAIEQFRVIRYVATDHCSGALRVRYYPHAESGEHTVRFLAWLMAPKAVPNDPFHGAPLQVMVDPGATSAGLVKRFCQRLDINLIVNKPGNPRAKGQVEQGNNLWESKFESGLRFQRQRVRNFDELNALAETFQLYFNSTAEHSRHGKTRFAKWLEITPEQLRVTADQAALLALATQEPKACTVQGDLTVRFMARVFRVSPSLIPGLAVKGRVLVHWHPFIHNTAMAVVTGEDGRERHVPLDEVTRDAHGFPSHAAQIGAEFKSAPATDAVTNAKRMARLASDTDSQEAADAARRAKTYQPFAHLGEQGLNPFLAAETAPVVPFLPRAGTPLAATDNAPVMAARMLTAIDAGMELMQRLGDDWRPEFFAFIERRFANGVAENQLDRLAAQLTGRGAEVIDVAAG